MVDYILVAVLSFWAGIIFHAKIGRKIDAYFERHNGQWDETNNGEP